MWLFIRSLNWDLANEYHSFREKEKGMVVNWPIQNHPRSAKSEFPLASTDTRSCPLFSYGLALEASSSSKNDMVLGRNLVIKPAKLEFSPIHSMDDKKPSLSEWNL